MMNFSYAKEETVTKYEDMRKLIFKLHSDVGDSCEFCNQYRITSVKCPASELCGCCEPRNYDTIYRDLNRTVELLSDQVIDLINKIKDLEEPEE